jgi:phytoene dehydrogenase-like protein
MEEYFIELGGVVTKNAEVSNILIDKNTALGVILKNGKVLTSDWVVSTTPVEHCLVNLLANKYHIKKFERRLKDPKTYPIYTYTTVAIKCPINVKEKALSLNVKLNEYITLDKDYDRISFRNFSYDKTVKTTKGYFVLQATVQGNDEMYHWWKDIKENGDYKEVKKQVGKTVLELAKKYFPDVKDQLEIIDVVTPCTYKRYLNSRHGSFQGFVHTSKGKALMQKGRLRKLKNFILGGQWLIQSGGLPTAVMSGKFSAQRICHSDKKPFVVPNNASKKED